MYLGLMYLGIVFTNWQTMASDEMMSDDSSSVMAHEKVQVLIQDKSVATSSEKIVEVKVEQTADTAEEVPQKFQDKETIELIKYIDKYVIITLVRDLCYNGFVHSIDPVSYSIILSVPIPREEGKFKTIVIPGSAVEKVDITQSDQSIKPPERKQIDKISTADLQLRKTKLLSWLKKNYLAVKVDGDTINFEGVILLPPYEDKDICTTNPVVAVEIKKLIARMPSDYVPT